MATRAELYSTPAIRVAEAARTLASVLLVIGALTAVTGWDPGVFVMLTGFVATLVAQLVVGIAAYRRAMRAPWPKVAPLDDEDEW